MFKVKIITVNLPVNDIKTIKGLVGENGLYPSRSELIRVAIRDFLVKELHVAKNFFSTEHSDDVFNETESDKNLVRIPYSDNEWKTFRIIQK